MMRMMGDVAATMNDEGILQLQEEHINIDIANEDDNHNTTTAVSRQGLDNDNNDGRGGVVDDWNHYMEGDDGTDDGLSQQQQHQQASPQQQQEEGGGGEEHSRPRQQQPQPPPHHHHTNTHHQRQRNNNNNNNNNQDWLQRRRNAAARFSCIYAWLSLTGAILAICTSARVGTTTTTTTTPTTTTTMTTTTNGGDAIVPVVTTSTTKSSTEMEMELQQLPSLQQTWNLASVPPLSSSNGPTIVATNEPLPLDGKTDSNWNRRNSPTVPVASSSSPTTTTTTSSLSSVEVSSSPPQQLQQESPLPPLPKQQQRQQEQSSGTSTTASTPPKRKRASMLSAAFLSRPMRRKAWTQPVAAPTTTDTSASGAFEKKDIQESIPAKPAMDSQEQQQQQPLQQLPVWLRKIVMMRPGFLTTSQDSSSSPQQHKQHKQQQSPKNKENESSPHDCPNMADLSSSSSSKWWQFFTVSSSQQQVADQPHVNRKPQAQAQPQEHKQQAENNIENATIISSDKATTTTTTDTPPPPPQKSKEPLPCTRWGCLLDTFRNVFVMGSIIRNEDAAPDDNNHRQEQEENQQQQREQQEQITTHWIMDQTLLNPSSHTLTDLVDKILTSTPRLLAIANFLLALTYILHTAVADWFLGGSRQARQQRQQQRQQRDGNDNNSNHSHHDGEAMDDNDDDEDLNNGIPGLDNPANAAIYSHHHYAILEHGREKMGGFLVFKLLLVSAVITPDTVDLLILLSWYTLLAFLRSLAHLCANAVQYASAAGQVPAPGVWQLLLLVWMSNCLAAVTCVALFSGAGVSMVLLLTCDCALTAVDVLAYLLQHVQATWEIQHATAIAQLEEEEQEAAATAAAATRHVPRTTANHNDHHDNNDDMGIIDYDEQRETPTEETQEQRSAEETARQIQSLEERHNSRVSLIESTVFALQLLGNVITVCHFLHIWSWHGVQFTLIDGVLALHLHSAISSASKKIAQRRNLHRIARDLDDVFPDATDAELAAAAAAGDVCCVCLSSLTSKKVKKVPCGHLYHTACLREVVERARSMEAARCPLCRASLLDGQYHNTNNNNNNNNTINDNGIMNNNNNNAVNRDLDIPEDGDNAAAGAAANNPEADQRPLQDQALFRISTEGIVPSWIPIHIPSFSFEVVRRAPPPPHPADPQQATTTTTTTIQPQEQDTNVPGAEPNNTNNRNDQDMANDAPPRQQEAPGGGGGTGTSSLLRRLLVIAGAMSMSPEEEAMALDQLVDMFPQYDRADLLRELRDLGGSAEVVAERILSGSFSGVPR